jgi:hypothetical protein
MIFIGPFDSPSSHLSVVLILRHDHSKWSRYGWKTTEITSFPSSNLIGRWKICADYKRGPFPRKRPSCEFEHSQAIWFKLRFNGFLLCWGSRLGWTCEERLEFPGKDSLLVMFVLWPVIFAVAGFFSENSTARRTSLSDDICSMIRKQELPRLLLGEFDCSWDLFQWWHSFGCPGSDGWTSQKLK